MRGCGPLKAGRMGTCEERGSCAALEARNSVSDGARGYPARLFPEAELAQAGLTGLGRSSGFIPHRMESLRKDFSRMVAF